MASCERAMAILPSRTAGQMNWPSSSRLVNRHRPSASAQRIFTVSPLRPRKINRWPENGFSSRACYTSSPRPLKDLRISVTPATSQMRVPDGRDIIGFFRSTREAARPVTPVTGSPASFCRGGTQHNRRWHSALRSAPGLCSSHLLVLDQVSPRQAALSLMMTIRLLPEGGVICGLHSARAAAI